MATPTSTNKVTDHFMVAQPPRSVSTTTLPLTFFDIRWFFCCPMQLLCFYELPNCSTFQWTQTVLPHLKESLSLTLRHFFPFAANLTWPPPPQEPYIHYQEGNGLQVAVVESKADFNHLVANHARDFKSLKSLFPQLPIISTLLSNTSTQVVPIMAIQFTVFPNSGISIGLTLNHLAADATSFYHFIKCWTWIHRSQTEDLTSVSLPYCKKDVIQDPYGIKSIYLKDIRSWGDLGPVGEVDPGNVLITSIVKRAKIEQLKHLVTTQSKANGELLQMRMSTFVVTCAFMWVNLMRLQEKISGGLLGDDILYYFVIAADCRQQLAFPISGTYFGNCLAQILVSARRGELMGESGIAVAAKAIARKILEFNKGALIGAEKWVSNTKEILKHGRLVSVAGTPKFRVYDTDFGWGKPKKYEDPSHPCAN
ncbi:hypothetical protein EZV62_020515 [Acer yangbiense]|uniref:Uncharacterized protein n=1 Tax=Acer yangbiense TaxID=1000413 RepID=A0A5C7HEJ4_9ROSI|nr:hypothetical protein EZV62_020515 [Acer yangbiense]